MKHLGLLLALTVLAPSAYAADAKPADLDLARLQALESAIRAGATRPVAVARPAPRPAESTAEGTAAPRSRAVDGFFPLPPRAPMPSSGSSGVQALIAAGAVQPPAKTAPAQTSSADDAATAEGLAAMETFRRNRGLAP